MGVTGLWTVVAPTARPTTLSSLNRKRLAVDASIWIYQFLKAVRDKEGNALRNSHVVGFFRRICKLLYFGIKPVFVFDGGAPVLKRETVRKRARRREGRREDASRTAGKLLAVQVARVAEEEERKRREGMRRDDDDGEEELPDQQDLVYVEEIGMSKQERTTERSTKFRRKDQYHLPDLDVSIAEMGAPNDPRIMSQAELEDYARQFHSGEDINLYDFSKIDFESPFFTSLPPGDRYNILNAARLRSRLRMGYSKEQLDGMFPDRMAFSRFQIERVRERNELTQRLMHINGMVEGDFMLDGGGRIAGEKGKEYILVKNEGVEGGWALGVVSNKNKGTERGNAIDVDDDDEDGGVEVGKGEEDEEEDFEDVAIEGLNRIPKTWAKKRKAKDLDYDASYEDAAEQIARKRKAVYEGRRARAEAQSGMPSRPAPQPAPATNGAMDEDSLFVPEDKADDDDELFEDVLPPEPEPEEEEDELQRAIAMSLAKPDDNQSAGGFVAERNSNRPDDSDDDYGFDIQTTLAESRRTKPRPTTNVRDKSPPKPSTTSQFGGPLPFESINLGQSLLGKKKSKKIEEDLSGGFDRDLGDDAFRKERPVMPVPDWFNATPNPRDRDGQWKGIDRPEDDDHFTYGGEDVDRREFLRRQMTHDVVDLEREDTMRSVVDLEREETMQGADDLVDDAEKADHEPMETSGVEVPVQLFQDASSEVPTPGQPEAEIAGDDLEKRQRDEEREKRYAMAREIAAEAGIGEPEDVPQPKMGTVAEQVQADPPPPSDMPNFQPEPAQPSATEEDDEDFDQVNWSDSDNEQAIQPATPGSLGTVDSESPQSAPGPVPIDDDEDEDFEDVQIAPTIDRLASPPPPYSELPPSLPNEPTQDPPEDDFDISSGEEDLMRQLAQEMEEHARFTADLNNQPAPSAAQAQRDFDAELKSLRAQQKKDRRDADEVTQTMILECQALLRLFGLPYITAPMEAEAQCAELVHLGLVDGIVTDDSDIFLFGGTRIYKNMFNAAKYVECYLASDLEKEFSLTREKLVRFSHLLGSDYTEGIPGVGPVTALEILTDFSDLVEFKDWAAKVQLGRPQDLENQLTTPFRRKFRRTVQKKLFLPTNFPDLRVDEAYLKPEVDHNDEPFQWGVPDLDNLRKFLMATIGWSQERTDEVLVPVIRDLNKREKEGTQSNITRFFSGGVGVGANGGGGLGGVRGSGGIGPNQARAEAMAPRNRTGKESGRMKNAFKRLRGEAERRRKRIAEGDSEDDEIEGLGEIAGVDGNGTEEAQISNGAPSAATNGDVEDDGTVAGDEGLTKKTRTKPQKKASKAKDQPKKSLRKTRHKEKTNPDTDEDDDTDDE
jgi:DNA excision repair protein ERCC-5